MMIGLRKRGGLQATSYNQHNVSDVHVPPKYFQKVHVHVHRTGTDIVECNLTICFFFLKWNHLTFWGSFWGPFWGPF